jgi:hypothetical protein
MARINYNDVDKYVSEGGGFFTLANDKQIARVRFLHTDMNDISGYAVHKVIIDGKNRYVGCLRTYADPIEACPFCSCGNDQLKKVIVKMFLQVVELDDNNNVISEAKLWERGKNFFGKMSGICDRYGHPLSGTVFEIQRNGAKGDTNTTYEIFSMLTDGTQLNQLPQKSEIEGNLVLEKTYNDMMIFVNSGFFPEQAQQNQGYAPQQQNYVPPTQQPRPVYTAPIQNQQVQQNYVPQPPVSQPTQQAPTDDTRRVPPQNGVF